jgi:uncharacterized membrane protein
MTDRIAPPRIIDTKLPLTWLLSTAGTIIAFMVMIALNFNSKSDALSAKMDAILASNAEAKIQSDKRDVKHENLKEQVYGAQRVIDAHDLRISNLERSRGR